MVRLQRAVQSVRSWPSTAERQQAGLQHAVWGASQASNADRALLLDVLLEVEAARLQVSLNSDLADVLLIGTSRAAAGWPAARRLGSRPGLQR